jgi:hypothetical protein
MLEYFLFSFAHTPLLVGEFIARAEAVAGGGSTTGPNNTTATGRQKSFYGLLSRDQKNTVDRSLEKTPYMETLRSFLSFFLPSVSPASGGEEQEVPATQQKPFALPSKDAMPTLQKDIYACRYVLSHILLHKKN